MEVPNKLYYGDNFDILRLYVKDESVDLIYLDPPFKSDQNYNILFTERNGSRSHAQIKAFKDTWEWDQVSARAYEEIVEYAPDSVSNVMRAFRTFLCDNDMLAYLSMMAPRLLEMRRVLKPSGSIYLHCDPTASHYLKMLMDAIFGVKNFRNEIVWHYRTGNIAKKQFQRKHDILLFYSKTKTTGFNPIEIKEYYSQIYGPEFKPSFKGRKHDTDKYGAYRLSFIDDVWDISAVFTLSNEHLDYPTQKPEALLERIIKASSNKGDLVLDPFCGCGTTIAVAQRLKRKWVGIDITHLAIALIKHRLQGAFGKIANYNVIGEPITLVDAEVLAKEDPMQFQFWATGLIGARPIEKRIGKDKGVDGRLRFHDEPLGGKTKEIILSVKSGNINVSHIRDLRGVVEREKAEIGVFLTLREPTRDMKREVASAGFYKSSWGNHPRMQILTIKQLLDGKSIDYPPHSNITFRKAPRAKDEDDQQISIKT